MKNTSINRVILVGIATSDPAPQKDGSSQYAIFSLTTEEHVRKSDTELPHYEHHNICWLQKDQVNDVRITRGQRLYVEGRLKTVRSVDESGTRRYSTQVVANFITVFDI